MKRYIIIGVILLLVLIAVKVSWLEKIPLFSPTNSKKEVSKENIVVADKIIDSAEKLIDRKKWIDAKKIIFIAIDNNNTNASAYFDLAWINYNLNLPVGSLIIYCQKIISLDSTSCTPYIIMAGYYSDKQQYIKVINTINKLLNDSPTVNYMDTIDFIKSYDLRAEAEYESGRYTDALFSIKMEMKFAPIDKFLYTQLGLIYLRSGKYNDAISACDTAIFYNDTSAKAYIIRGKSYRILKEYDKALRDLNNAIRLAPNDVNGYYNRGILYDSMKMKTKARADYEKANSLGEFKPI